MGTISDSVISTMKNTIQKSWFSRLFDMEDTSVSSTNVFLFLITLIGFVLLAVPAIVLLVECYFNHTISTDLSGMASYIGAVAALFASGGITKAWSNYSNYKYNAQKNGHADLLPDNKLE